MSKNKKLRVMGLLGAGGFAVGFSLYRLVLVLQDGTSPDQTIVFMCVIMSGYVSKTPPFQSGIASPNLFLEMPRVVSV
jgi:hypothetical protein